MMVPTMVGIGSLRQAEKEDRMSEGNRYHCCATCIHFRVEKETKQTTYRCARLSYETKPTYQFRCWSPKAQVRRLMGAKRDE